MKKALTTIFILQGIIAYSQNNYMPGLIINLYGDTLTGYIYNDSPINCGEYCTFKTKDDTIPITYTANEISGYKFLSGKYYVSKEIPVDSITKEKVFLQWLVKGKLSIYSYIKDRARIYYFVETQSNELLELKNSEVEKFNNYGARYRYRKKEYISVLSSLMQNAEMIPIINNSKLTDKALIRVIKIYSEKISKENDCIVFKKPEQRSEISIVIGKNWTNTNLSDISLFRNNEYVEKNSLLIGIGYCLSNIDYISRRISYQTGIYYNKYSNTVNERSQPEFSFEALQVPILIGYSLYFKNFEPFFLAGIQVSYKIKYESTNIYLRAFSNVSLGPDIGIGLKYKLSQHYIIELTASDIYEFKSFFPQQQHFGNIFSMQIRLGYLF
jgi:hypothetical protein